MDNLFIDIPFPKEKNIIYILYFIKNSSEIVFYIGNSTRSVGRFGDYISANFTASTDFKVGEAIKYILLNGYEVRVKYKDSNDIKKEEEYYISVFKDQGKLLNDLKGYDYKTAIKSEEKEKIINFINFYYL